MLNTAPSSVVALVGLLLASCSGSASQSDDCHSAALAQATAELDLNAVLLDQTQEVADHTHDEGTDPHQHNESSAALNEDLVLAARIDVIIAEAETRGKCG
ncbi:MAG: hypothetical protein OXB92_06470 [Acidimicrobiaceae bacterium]|nr:hypothetical protein [Acidimicrobiia bacterium]MCY4493482.1 hypothetical protein [Acidimicrobiaceae bacterium]